MTGRSNNVNMINMVQLSIKLKKKSILTFQNLNLMTPDHAFRPMCDVIFLTLFHNTLESVSEFIELRKFSHVLRVTSLFGLRTNVHDFRYFKACDKDFLLIKSFQAMLFCWIRPQIVFVIWTLTYRHYLVC